MTHIHPRRTTAVMIVALCALAGVSSAATRVIRFKTDGKAQEAKYLHKHDSRTFVLSGWAKPTRNLDGRDRFVIWRFDTTDTTQARCRIRLLNSYAMSISADGQNFRQVAREVAAGGSNEGWKTADLTALLPSRYVYVKLTHGDADKYNGGYGACVFEVQLELEDERDIAVATAARTSGPITIDGKLDEPDWQRAQPLRTFSDRFMNRTVSHASEIRLCYDADHWYIGAVLEQPGADKVLSIAKGHDAAAYAEDAFEPFLMPPGQKDYYHIATNIAGTVFDELNAAGGQTWDSEAEVAVRADAEQWVMEMAVPVARMNAPPFALHQVWRMGLNRVLTEFSQYGSWSSIQGGGFHSAKRFGRVHLVDTVDAPLPTLNTQLTAWPTMGDNTLTIHLNGPIDRAAHELSLEVVPVPLPKLGDDQQDLDQMNPTAAAVALPDDVTQPFETPYTLDRFGAAHITATLRDKPAGRIISRAVQAVSITRQQVEPIELIVIQPYVSTHVEVVPVEVRINLDDDKMAAARVRTTILDSTDQVIVAFDPAPANEFARPKRVQLPVQALAVGQYTVRAALLDSDDRTLAFADKPLGKYIPPGRPRRVTIDPNGVCLVDGQPMMPLGFMLGGASTEAVAAGYNVGLWGCEYPKDPHDRAGLDLAEANGGMVALHICNYLRGKNDYEGLRARVSRLKDEPALLAWYLADEPEGYGDTPEILRKAYRIIKEVDPNHPVYICTNAPGMIRHYEGCADIVGTDPYPIPSHPLSMVASWTDAAVRAADANGQAVWMTPQGFGWSEIGNDGRNVRDDEYTNMLLTCFIHGAKGIIWWPYGAPFNHHWPHFQKMGRLSRFIEPWILHGRDVEGLPPGVQVQDDVHWRAWQHNDKVLILAANLSREQRTVRIPLPPAMQNLRLVFEDMPNNLPQNDQPLTPIDQSLTLKLAPVQTAVFLSTQHSPQ